MSEDAQARARARLGTVLADKWRLEGLLGLGGMAAVYTARHRNGARAAIKLLHPELGRVPELRERFLREGYLANTVEHPCAVRVLDDDVVTGGPDGDLAYLVMELLEGESVDARMQRLGAPLGEDDVLLVADDVLGVLEAAHDKGIVHRDVKPENLFFARDPDREDGETRVKVLDFGLARMDLGIVTRAGLALGTPSFMAPEQAAGRSAEIDGRTDLFGLGATMFRCLTGARIHDGANGAEIVAKMATLPAPPLRSVRADVSEPVAAIVDRALQFRREDRYPNAAAMRVDVQAARAAASQASARAKIGNEPTVHDERSAPGPSTSTAAAPMVTAQPSRASATTSVAPSRPRWRAPIGFAVVWVVVIAGAATLFFFVRGHLAGSPSQGGGESSGAASGEPSDRPQASDSSTASPAIGAPNGAESVEALTAEPDESPPSADAGTDAPHSSVSAPLAVPKKPPPVIKLPPIKKKKKGK